MARCRFSQKTNKWHLTLLIREKRNLFVRFLGESTPRQSAYGFIRPLLGHFW
jgi:hypothetical protein